jgi:hypothetical protein
MEEKVMVKYKQTDAENGQGLFLVVKGTCKTPRYKNGMDAIFVPAYSPFRCQSPMRLLGLPF